MFMNVVLRCGCHVNPLHESAGWSMHQLEQLMCHLFFQHQLMSAWLLRGLCMQHQWCCCDWCVAQVDYLRTLNRTGQWDSVVDAFESGKVTFSQDALGEYVKALVRLDRLDNTRLLSTLHRGAEQGLGPRAAMYAPPAPGPWSYPAAAAATAVPGPGFNPAALAGAGGGDVGGVLGTVKNPLVITNAEPSLFSQIARLVRSLGLAFILVTAVGAFLDEKTLSKGLLNNPDMKPQFDSTTR